MKKTLDALLIEHAVTDVHTIESATFEKIISELDIKFNLHDYMNNQLAMLVLVHINADKHFVIHFVHIAADNSSYDLNHIATCVNMYDALSEMHTQLVIDFEHYDD